MSDEIDHDWYFRKEIERPPDRKVEEAKKALLERFFPLHVVRVMPETYINKVDEAGGFSLILGSQNYPPLAEALAERVRDGLGLPVYCVTQWPDTAGGLSDGTSGRSESCELVGAIHIGSKLSHCSGRSFLFPLIKYDMASRISRRYR